jgi:hypothetical protein
VQVYSITVWISSLLLEAALIVRGRTQKAFGRFPFFYSYLTYIFAGSVATFIVYVTSRNLYPTLFWFYLLVTILAEFAVLVEISDHLFEPFPAIRQLGRVLCIGISAAFLLLYVRPSLLEARPMSIIFLDFALRISITKGVIVVVLLLVARYFRLAMNRNIAGLLLGFGLYLAVFITNFAAAEKFGKTLYTSSLQYIFPMGYTTCLVVWTLAMWHVESVSNIGHGRKNLELKNLLTQINTNLIKLLNK